MTRDYSQFFPPAGGGKTAERTRSKLDTLGWQPYFAQQVDMDDLIATPPARVVEVHRNGLHVVGDGIDRLIPPGPEATVGDWLLLDPDQPAASRTLHRKSLFKRRAPGTDRRLQLIAANVDTVFIVTSCNRDFNVARLERYVALAFDAEVTPVVLLTKADLCDDTDPYLQAASAISRRLVALALNALGPEPRVKLKPWCGPGQTIAFLGSSGVGKSSLVNALMDDQAVGTGAIREDDAKGRHTTTRRQLHFLPNGCAVLDTPGMRELQLADAQDGIADLFDDISALAGQCRFGDCAHDTEPGCAIKGALERGAITPERLARWNKLVAEERFNSASLTERKSGEKALQRTIRAIQKTNRK
ncbi:ribosome small subunit-dependent GTPase A [Pukyongiella litopenaei]|uniref:Small ribosomal subunit biogenesis GTPase RsgA n=1 Tax=Pukyongiella litopenaei TaxID=2605946 RepID=A0A2S0MM23_9RHOB|nr:ribosome small subunit-dependent GTPase A [Pukyongiella litopenaei]AVO36733.1 ribosome small subunit-dependent GTPase A [Pukyongiella litopenaei]